MKPGVGAMAAIASSLLLLPLSARAAQAPAPGEAPKGDLMDVTELALDDLLNRPVQISTRTETTIDEAPGITAVIDREDIEASGAKTLGDLLRMVPGFDTSRTNLGSGDPVDGFYARGVRSDFSQTTLVLLNGQNKFNDLTFASPWLSQRISAQLIERVEVIRGPGSALYGGSAFAAVVNIVTRDAAGPDGTSATALYGQHHALYGHALHKGTLFGWHLAGQAQVFSEGGRSYEALRYDKSYAQALGGGLELPAADRITDGVRPSLDASFSLASPENHFRAQAWYTNHNPAPWLTGFYPTPALSQFNWQSTQLFFNAEYDVTEHFTVGAHYSSMYRGERGLLAPALGAPALGVRLDPSRIYGSEDLFGTVERNGELAVNALYRQELGSHSLLAGVALSREDQWGAEAIYWGELWDPSLPADVVVSTNPQEGLIAYPNHQRYSAAVFAQDIWKLHRTLSLTVGLRYDRYLDIADPFILSPRAAVVWTPIKDQVFKFAYGQGFRPPSGFEQLGILSGSTTGNSAIRPERIYTFELAYITYFDKLRLQVAAYYSRMTDHIVAVEDNDPNKPNRFANSGNARTVGAEAELQGRNWWVNYSFVNSGIHDAATNTYSPEPLVAPQSLNAGVNIDLSEPLRFSTQVFVRAPRLTANGGSTDFQVTWDVKARYRIKWFDLFAGITNVLGQQYLSPLNDGGQYPAPYRGRELFCGVDFKL